MPNLENHEKLTLLKRMPKMLGLLNYSKVSRKYPLAKFCELCPENDKRKAVDRHHPDYDYPQIYLSLCRSCHRFRHPHTKPHTKKYFWMKDNR